MPVTYDFACMNTKCRAAFEVMGLAAGTNYHKCPSCGAHGERVYEPGPWTTAGTGVFKPYWDPGLGARIESKSQMKRIATQLGMVPKGTTPKKTPKAEPTLQEVHKGMRDLKREDVVRHRERREQAEWEARNGPSS